MTQITQINAAAKDGREKTVAMIAKIEARHLVPILAGYVVSAAVYSRLPAYLDTPSFVPLRLFTAFTLPTAVAITIALMHLVWTKDFIRTEDEGAAAACRAIGFRLTMFVMALHILAMVNLAGAVWLRPWAPRIVVVMFGALLIGIGNLLPLTRPNLVVGLRTRLTLANRCLWMRVHRVAGSIFVGVGAVLAVSGLFLSRPLIALAINAAFVTGVFVFAVSYRRYARLNG